MVIAREWLLSLGYGRPCWFFLAGSEPGGRRVRGGRGEFPGWVGDDGGDREELAGYCCLGEVSGEGFVVGVGSVEGVGGIFCVMVV